MPVPIFGRSSIGTLSLMHSFWAEGNGTHTGGQVSSPRSASGGKDKSMYYDQQESGKRICVLRKEKGYTQEGLAEVIGIDAKRISKIERGAISASFSDMILFSEFFKVTLDYLIIGKKEDPDVMKKKVQDVIAQLQEIVLM